MAVLKLKDGRWICYYRQSGRIKREYFGRGPEGEYLAKQRNLEMKIKKNDLLGIELDKTRAEFKRIRDDFGNTVLPKSKKGRFLEPA